MTRPAFALLCSGILLLGSYASVLAYPGNRIKLYIVLLPCNPPLDQGNPLARLELKEGCGLLGTEGREWP